MKKIIVMLLLISGLTACKKKEVKPDEAPLSPPVVAPPTVLPEQYIILNDGGVIDTIECTGGERNIAGIAPADTNNTYMVVDATGDAGISIIIRMPTDSIKLSNMQAGVYATEKHSATDKQFDGAYYNVKRGRLALSKSSPSGPYLSEANPSTSTYFNKITSITRYGTVYNSVLGKLCEVFIIEGEFSVHTKHVSNGSTKDYSGKYKFKITSRQF